MMARGKGRNSASRPDELLAAIKERPEDRALRGAYADWLEERGDPLAELVRIEEEMRQLAIYSDRYWELKVRRNELRERSDPKWLKTMRYGTDYEPVFCEMPNGWKERWRLIREFVERWHGIPMNDVGGQSDQVRRVTKKTGYELPPSIREWIAFLQDLEERGAYGSVFRDGLSLSELEDHAAFSLMIQGEGDYHWAVKKEHLGDDDPPVDGYLLDYEEERGRFVHDKRWAPQVSTWALIHITAYLGITGAGGFGTSVSDATALAERLSRALPVATAFGDVRIFETTNIVASISSGWGGTPHLDVHISKQIPKKQVPAVLLEYAGQGGWTSGMFSLSNR
jgi:uncharacterized protein (TIGR02996 family)